MQANFHIDFLSKRKTTVWISGALVVISLLSFMFRGFDLGIDFTGGVLLEVQYDKSVELDTDIRPVLDAGGFENTIILKVDTSKDVMIRIPPKEGGTDAKVSTKVIHLLKQSYSGEIKVQRVEFVGPQIGKELTEDGGLAMLYTLIGILIYVALRFEYRFAVGSVAALIHDVVIVLGVFSLFQIGFDLTVLAAILAVIGYSLNDTIVVFDRIRENFRKMRKGTSEEVINSSLNQTLSRTLTTSFTTLLVLVALLSLGGEVMFGFALALIIGVLVGTYSSIYVASTTALVMGISKADLMPPEKEGADIEEDEEP
ncbi:MAG: protein translocase subunit SecF [Methylococcales bacterium]|nr:protein translocase subunit SecF [Methylococcales bacterium]